MLGKKKSQVPDASKRAGLDLTEIIGLCFSFLWFHRGILLFGLVLWGLYHVLIMANDTVSETKRRDATAPVFVYTPRPVINESLPENGLTSEARSSRPSAALPAAPMPVVSPPEKKMVERKQDPETLRFQRFLETASVDSLERRFTVLMQQVPSVSAFDAVSAIKNCQSICERLREKELTSDQQLRLAIMELEAISQFDAINVQHAMGIPGLKDRLISLATRLHDHPSVEVAAKAHLAIFASRAIDLMFDPTQEELGELSRMYETHVDDVLLEIDATIVMADLLQQIVTRHQFDEVIALRRDIANRMLRADAVDFDEVNANIKERMIFGDLGLSSLSTRIDGGIKEASQDVEIFCQRLERFPDTRKQIYQFAFDVMENYVVNEQFGQAAKLLDALQLIHSKIPNPKTKDWIGEGLSDYAEKISLAQVPQ